MLAPFDTAEYRARVKRVSEAAQAEGIDLVVVLREASIVHLTGYEGYSEYVPQVAIIRPGDADPIVVLREMDIHCAFPTVYMDHSRIESYPESYIGTPDRSPWDFIGARVKELAGNGRIGVELAAKGLSHRGYLALVNAMGGREPKDTSVLLARAKHPKSPAELALMRKAGRIADQAMKEGIERMGVGVRECEVAAAITNRLILGVDGTAGGPAPAVTMPTTPWAGAPHMKWSDRRYAAGSHSNFELAGSLHRYHAALCRTAIVGKPTKELTYVHESVLASFQSALDVVKAGVTCSEIHRAFTRVFAPTGVRKTSRIGYALGIDWGDDAFSLQADDHTALVAGSTFHLIIGIWEKVDPYIFSESIVVGERSGESLSKLPRELFVC
jgi:ectoine hydrolase